MINKYQLDYLDELEAEAIYILREVAGQFEKPALLFSGGKDSITIVHLALKAFRPGKFPFPLVHIDTGHNFEETIIYRDQMIERIGEKLIVGYVQDDIDSGKVVEQKGKNASRNQLQTVTLLNTIAKHKFDACIGGARRDEEKARAKERIFSVRDEFGQWDPRAQRPELWDLYNTRHRPGENFRVFPLSNWTELDVWQYIGQEGLELPSIYFAHRREVFRRDGLLLAVGPYTEPRPDDVSETPFSAIVRYRTVGDMTCTAAVESTAATVEEVIAETEISRVSERGATRADDRFSFAAMEDRKREGYF